MTQFYIIGGVVSLLLLGGLYLGWHHHVYHQGYEARVAEEQAAVKTAQPTIQKQEIAYEANVKAAASAPTGPCGNRVDPAISTVLDRLH